MGPIREMLGQSGVNEQKWRVLRVLHEQGPQDLSRVAAEACLLLPSLTRIAASMEAENLVQRSTPPQDRRRTVLQITEAGSALLQRHAAQSAQIFARFEAEFGRERLEHLLDLLEDLQAMGRKPK